MASDKKVVLIFSGYEGKSLGDASTPGLSRLLQKGTLFTNTICTGHSHGASVKTLAASGAEQGETLWEAAEARGLSVGALTEPFDMCVLDISAEEQELEKTVSEVLEVADRSTLIVLLTHGAMVFCGPGIAKGKVVTKETCPCVVAPTVAYVADFPVPAGCEAPIAYAALKDINLKLNEIKKLNDTIANMEAAIERKARQPWDKHDCA